MSEILGVESEFWSVWRVTWGPRLFYIFFCIVLIWIGSYMWNGPAPRVVSPAVDVRWIEGDREMRKDAVRMAKVCHGWLATGQTRKDTLHSLSFEHTSPYTRRTEMCLNWLVYAGETLEVR
jgi:hypothetical protein